MVITTVGRSDTILFIIYDYSLGRCDTLAVIKDAKFYPVQNARP